MVLTRSQLAGSPRNPLTPKSRRKLRKKRVDDADEQNDVIKSRSNGLEAINEEDENAATDDCAEFIAKGTSQMCHADGANKAGHHRGSIKKSTLEIPDTIIEGNVEEAAVGNDDVYTEGISIEKFEVQCNKSDSKLTASNDSTKWRFYFPPPKTLVPSSVMSMSIEVGMEIPDTYIDVKGSKRGKKKIDDLYAKITVNTKDSCVKDSAMTHDFERNYDMPGVKSMTQLQKERKMQREQTAGKEWFNLKPPELTSEVERDLKILQMRSVLDPQRFYKHNDRKAVPRYFQIGKIMDCVTDFYSSRIPKKQRKPNLTEELLADAEFQRYRKRKYNEIQMYKKAQRNKDRRMRRRRFTKGK